MAEDNDKSISIETHNQSGGTNVGQINVNPPAGWRNLNSAPKAQQDLLTQLEQYRDKTIVFAAIAGDQEATNFADQIRTFLGGSGFTVSSHVTQLFLGISVPAFWHEVQSDGTVLIGVGNQYSTVK